MESLEIGRNENTSTNRCSRIPRRILILLILLLIILVLPVIIAVIIVLNNQSEPSANKLIPPNPEVPLPPSSSVYQKFEKAAVCTDAVVCSAIGRDILAQNGSAMDAAIAALFCNGVVNSQSMGLGGGFLMTIYIRDKKQALFLNARESAPKNATEDIYQSDSSLARKGPLAVAVPGELPGYWAAHKRFGKLSWYKVIEPTIKLCREGYKMTKHQDDSLRAHSSDIVKDPYLKETFVNPKTGLLYKEGMVIKNTKLCDTLEEIAKEGSDNMYKGKLGKTLANDIQDMGGLISEQDFADYKVKWDEPITTKLHKGEIIYSSPPPGSGALLTFILNIMDEYRLSTEDVSTLDSTIRTYHRIAEAFKYAFAKRGDLGDPDFVNISELLKNLTSKEHAFKIQQKIDDTKTSNLATHYGGVKFNKDEYGTAHISVLAANGDAVSVTSSVNFYFGARVTSPSTGIILNSGIDDFSFPKFENYFSIPPSERNRIASGKRSMSSMTPTIITDKNGDVRLVIGASGGSKIFTATALVIMRHLWFGENIKEAVDSARFHHQLYPMEFSYEYGILQQIIDGLEKLGHKTSRYRERGSIICAIAKIKEIIFANADFRKGGEVYGI